MTSMRVCIALAIMLSCVTVVAQRSVNAQTAVAPFRLVAIANKSPVEIVRFYNGGVAGGLGAPRVTLACLSFKNMDRKTATEIVFHFRYYNDVGDHNGDDVLTRRGHFSTGTVIEAASDRTSRVHPEDCADIHYPADGISLNTFWVQSITFEDGTTWTSPDVSLPEHLPKWHPRKDALPSPAPSATNSGLP